MEIAKIETAAKNNVEFADVIVIMIYTGFRLSELLELTPFSYNKEKGEIIGGVKTDVGKNRLVIIKGEAKIYFDRWAEKGGQYIICKQGGTAYSPTQFRRKHYKALDKIGVKRLTPHAARHTFDILLAQKERQQKIFNLLLCIQITH